MKPGFEIRDSGFAKASQRACHVFARAALANPQSRIPNPRRSEGAAP
jgi:hypothetical protein